MIYEQATLQIAPDNAEAFEAAIASSTSLFQNAQDCHSLALERVIEHPGLYVLRIGWTSVEAHTETFVSSEAFARFGALVGPFLIAAPEVIHVAPTSLF